MAKLHYTKQDIEKIKSQIYFNADEEEILDMWLKEKSIVEMSIKLNLSTSTISRRKKSILDKIKRISK